MRPLLMIRGGVAAALLVLLLAGCAGRMSPSPAPPPTPESSQPSPTVLPFSFARMDEPQVASDRLPPGTTDLVATTSRLLATTRSARYFVAQTKAGWYCTVIDPTDGSGPLVGCGGPDGLAYGPLTTSNTTLSARLVADGDTKDLDEPGYTRVSPNLAVKELQ